MSFLTSRRGTRHSILLLLVLDIDARKADFLCQGPPSGAESQQISGPADLLPRRSGLSEKDLKCFPQNLRSKGWIRGLYCPRIRRTAVGLNRLICRFVSEIKVRANEKGVAGMGRFWLRVTSPRYLTSLPHPGESTLMMMHLRTLISITPWLIGIVLSAAAMFLGYESGSETAGLLGASQEYGLGWARDPSGAELWPACNGLRRCLLCKGRGKCLRWSHCRLTAASGPVDT